MQQEGLLLVISGPSGAGKGTVCKALLQEVKDLKYSVSVTTRKPRVGEQHGVNYFFTSVEEFEEMIKNDQLLEWAKVYDNYYGTPKDFVIETIKSGQDVILEIDVNGAKQIFKNFPNGVFIFLLPPSMEELCNRIYKRGTETKDVIQKRLAAAQGEIEQVENYNYVVLNDEVENAVNKIKAIIIAEKCKVNRNKVLKEEYLK
ncbi:guanylate kinase [Anaerobranca gottschalkii]|uniref:Guanylate kinase n=1 Tax=Anaerobranca gottschalkii DSM 13577 TaxID=1120990 RepID=A0A1H9YX12_9FIRM|nr:guanylate kinase [Anaerobranca gottschalkii]SES73736.1 guanylate kinase [Anaerobranca gottschalkii DSM 13577]